LLPWRVATFSSGYVHFLDIFEEDFMGKPIEKTGLRGMMARVSVKGLNALDKRSAGYRALAEWRASLTKDLGGDLSTQEAAMVELICRTKLFLDSIDLFLMEQPSLVNKKKRVAFGILATRNSMANTLASLLDRVGLQRRDPPMKSLTEFLAERKGAETDEHSADDGRGKTVQEDICAEEEVVRASE
jgi:hypothetical protein